MAPNIFFLLSEMNFIVSKVKLKQKELKLRGWLVELTTHNWQLTTKKDQTIRAKSPLSAEIQYTGPF